jgi:hypothetical protein
VSFTAEGGERLYHFFPSRVSTHAGRLGGYYNDSESIYMSLELSVAINSPNNLDPEQRRCSMVKMTLNETGSKQSFLSEDVQTEPVDLGRGVELKSHDGIAVNIG